MPAGSPPGLQTVEHGLQTEGELAVGIALPEHAGEVGEAAAGGFVGHWLYTKIRDRSFSVAWFQEPPATCPAIAPRQPPQADATTKEMHMTDPSRSPDTGVAPDSSPTTSYPGTPRWVKVTGIVILVVVLLVGIIMLTGVGGPHGPGRHLPSGGAGGHIPPIALGLKQP